MDASGRILVPGIYDHVAPVTDEEREMYEAIDLDLEEYRSSSRVEKFLFDTKVRPPSVGVREAGGHSVACPRRPPAVLRAAAPRVSGPKAAVNSEAELASRPLPRPGQPDRFPGLCQAAARPPALLLQVQASDSSRARPQPRAGLPVCLKTDSLQ